MKKISLILTLALLVVFIAFSESLSTLYVYSGGKIVRILPVKDIDNISIGTATDNGTIQTQVIAVGDTKYSDPLTDIDSVAYSTGTPVFPGDKFSTCKADVAYFSDFYYENLKSWTISLYDTKYVECDGVNDGKYLRFSVTSPMTDSFKTGIPCGSFNLDPKNYKTEAYQCHEAFSYDNTTKYRSDITGTLKISLVNDVYTFEADVVDAEGKNIKSVYSAKNDAKNIIYSNVSCMSTLTEDLNLDIKNAYMRCQKNSSRVAGADEWLVTLCGEGAQYDVVGENYSGAGTIIQAMLYVPTGEEPSGKFVIAYGRKLNTAYPFFNLEKEAYTGTGCFTYEGSPKNSSGCAPASGTDGVITIIKNADGTYAIDAKFSDDNPDEVHYFSGSYNGNVKIFNSLDNGDFTEGKASFYGDKSKNGTSLWNLSLTSTTDGAIAEALSVEITLPQTCTLATGLPTGVYSFDASLKENTFSAPKVTIYSAGEAVTNYSGGTLKIEKHGDIYLVWIDFTKENGDKYSAYYAGNLSFENCNFRDAIFLSDGASVEVSKLDTSDGITNWYMKFTDGGSEEEGSMISLDIYAPEQTGNDLPLGKFNVGELPGIGKNEFSWYALFTDNDEGLQYSLDSGSITIAKTATGGYKFNFDFTSTTGNKLTGNMTVE